MRWSGTTLENTLIDPRPIANNHCTIKSSCQVGSHKGSTFWKLTDVQCCWKGNPWLSLWWMLTGTNRLERELSTVEKYQNLAKTIAFVRKKKFELKELKKSRCSWRLCSVHLWERVGKQSKTFWILLLHILHWDWVFGFWFVFVFVFFICICIFTCLNSFAA